MKIQLPQLNKTLSCDKGENLFQVLKSNHVAIASSCNGDGICGKCIVKVESPQPLQPMTNLEIKWHDKNHFGPQQRLSCQMEALEDLTVSTTYW